MEKWVIKNKKADFERIRQECEISEVLARCLVNRGMEDPKIIDAFLNPKTNRLYHPFLMKDMKKACDILTDKIREGKKIRIIGDYDVDGVIATYVLFRTLNLLGANVDYEIPDRLKDGYGMNPQMVEAAHQNLVDTILTCDNGIVAVEPVQLAKEYGMTVIITDHHSLLEVQEGELQLPNADAILNPKQPDCNYPYPGLCGAAIAFKLCGALLSCHPERDWSDFLNEILSYTAIATVCDVMELTDENRIIVKCGIDLLKASENKGLNALMNVSSVEKEQLTAFHLGFVIGPCLNASGRLDTAKKGIELLLCDTEEAAEKIAKEVFELNQLRKAMTTENVEKAIRMIEESELKRDKILVLFLNDCHESIAGIIAGRIRERYHRPVIVLTEANHCVKGSGRSIEQYNMIAELTKCRSLFLKVGGHPMAAGMSLIPENIEPLRQYLNDNTDLTQDMLIPKVTIDIHLPFRFITEALVNELKMLEPFGKGNEKPLFAEKDLKIKSAFVIGKKACGLRLRVENQFGKEMEAVYFGDIEEFFEYIGNTYGKEELHKLKTGRNFSPRISLTYYPRINEYNGFQSIQLMIHNYR